MKTRTAAPQDAENIARMVNAAFRPERFFTDGDRTSPEKVLALLEKGKFLLVEEAGCAYRLRLCGTARGARIFRPARGGSCAATRGTGISHGS